MFRTALFLLLCTGILPLRAQLGGTQVFKALSLPSTPRITGLGGSALAVHDNDLNTAVDNPALIQAGLHSQLAFSNNFYFAGIQYGNLAYAHTFRRAGAFAFSMKYISYGKLDGRDEAGNPTGNFRAGDYVMTAGRGGVYKEQWLYGINLKLVYSHLETYHAVGMAVDLAGAWHNEDKELTVTALLRNAGVQLKSYTDAGREPLPLEVSVGLSKKFQNFPLRLQIVVHNLQKPDLAYENPALITSVNILGEEETDEVGIVDKIFRHFIFGAEIDIAKPLSVRFGYNHLLRQETGLSIKRGLAGVSVGAGIHIKQFTLDYTYARYHAAANINHLGLLVNLDAFAGRQKSPDAAED